MKNEYVVIINKSNKQNKVPFKSAIFYYAINNKKV